MGHSDDPKIKKGWKDHLLKSGVPLEYQVARILAAEEMSVEADFSFMRRDHSRQHEKEWSVDIAASWLGPDQSDVLVDLELLIECKFRSPGKSLLFLAEPNDLYSPVTLGVTVNSFDVFSSYSLPLGSSEALDAACKFVYKGIEIYDHGAHEEDFRHGIQQLRYATPALLRKSIDFFMGDIEAPALFFSKILVTNAPLRILRQDVNIKSIQGASDIGDISDEIDRVILYSDYGPDYEDHFRSVFSAGKSDRLKRSASLRRRMMRAGKEMNYHSDPLEFIRNLSIANRFELAHIGTQFFVATLDGLPSLLADIKAVCVKSYERRIVTAKKKSKR